MNPESTTEDVVLTELRALNARFIHNYITNDVRSHDDLLHPEFVCIRSNGHRIGREDYLRAWATGFDPDIVIYWDVHDEFISVFGDTALVRSTNRHTLVTEGREITARTCYTDIYLRTRTGWKCVQAQLTPVIDPPGSEFRSEPVSVYLRGKKVR